MASPKLGRGSGVHDTGSSFLFVDDDRMILRSLERILRRKRPSWDTRFASNVADALAEMQGAPIDIVVSDLHMPVGGIELLKRVREAHPGAARILLSGSAGTPSAIESTPIAHQFIEKPIDPAELIDCLERARSLQRLLTPELRYIAGRVTSLPAVPSVYGQLVKLANEPATTLKDVSRLVQRDAAIAGRILQMVNSGFFYASARIASIDHAVQRLGLGLVKQLVLVTELFQLFEGHNLPEGFSIRREQEASLLTAAIAANMVDSGQRGETYTAALLHNVGVLILATHLDSWGELYAQAVEERRPLDEVENERYGTSHGPVGAYLLGLWSLPSKLVDAAANHHAPQGNSFDTTGVVHVAAALAAERLGQANELDHGYLDRVRVSGRIDEWRAMAEEITLPQLG